MKHTEEEVLNAISILETFIVDSQILIKTTKLVLCETCHKSVNNLEPSFLNGRLDSGNFEIPARSVNALKSQSVFTIKEFLYFFKLNGTEGLRRTRNLGSHSITHLEMFYADNSYLLIEKTDLLSKI